MSPLVADSVEKGGRSSM